jgi:tetratricopeptide (TPR) repeat protein
MKCPVSRGVRLILFLTAPAFAADAKRVGTVGPITFYREIAPIISRNCAPCHKPGESTPFSLLTYDDVKRHAHQIADVTNRRFMPPWPPDAGYGDFVEERRLTASQIRLIQDWVKQGAPAGSPTASPAPVSPDPEWKLGKPDLVLNVQQPYQLPADGPEVFWNFVIPVPLYTTRWVKAVEIRPGAPRVIHHASLLVDRSGSARRHEQTPGAGFAGMDVTLDETTFDPDGVFLAWKPGSTPNTEPDGIAWRAEPGMFLVFSVHLRPSGKAESVAPSIGLHFTDQPQTKFPMLVALQRDASIDIPPGERDYVVTDSFKTPLDVQVLAVYPHAHYLGKLVEGFATLPDGSRKWLIRISDWDLNWQGVYHYKRPVMLPRGSVITMRFHYDNSEQNVRNTSKPPKRVRGGSQAEDEMGNLWLQLLPVANGDQRPVLLEALMRQRLERSPEDFLANYNVGDLLLSGGKASEAIPYFERAWKAAPRNVIAATELGVALMSASKAPEARAQFQRALEIDPTFTDARYDLASAEAALSNWEQAADQFQAVVQERPTDAKAREHLGEVLMLWGDEFSKAGNFEEAARRYDYAIRFRAADAELRMNFGIALARLGRLDDARFQLEAALRFEPGLQRARQMLATVEAQQRERAK